MSNLEKAAGAHSEEVTALQQSLVTQKQLASKFNDRVSNFRPLSANVYIHVHVVYMFVNTCTKKNTYIGVGIVVMMTDVVVSMFTILRYLNWKRTYA